MKRRGRGRGLNDANQLLIDWTAASAPPGAVGKEKTNAAPTSVPRAHAKRASRHVLPCPKPLAAAVKSGHFGYAEDGKPVRPSAAETHAIIRNHADKLIDLLDQIRAAPERTYDSLRDRFVAGIAAVAEDFGDPAAIRLQTYVEREAASAPSCRRS